MNAVRAISSRFGFGKADHKILYAGLILATFGGVAKLSGVARDVVVAARFGAGDALDAYVVAYTIPSLVNSIFIGAFCTTLIPTYIHLQKNNPRAAASLAANLLMLVCVVSALLVVAIGVMGRPLIELIVHGFSADKISLTLRLLYIFLPIIFIQGVSSFWACLLNSDGRFAISASTPLVTSLLSTLAVGWLGLEWGIQILAMSTLAGLTIEGIILGTVARKSQIVLVPKWHGYDHDTRAIVRQYFPILIGSFVTSITVFLDQAVASGLGPGSIASLNYGSKLINVVLTLIATAMGTAVLPYFSHFVAARDWRGARSCLHRWIAVMLLSSFFITAVFLLFADSIVTIMFQRGAFTVAETAVVATVMRCYSLQLPFYFCNILCVRMMVALRLNKVLLGVTFCDLAINASLDFLLVHFFGVAGIAIACSAVYVFSFVCVSILVERRFQKEFASARHASVHV